MIQKPTAFILGAGTSAPYRFPAGEQFFRDARSLDLDNLKSKVFARSQADVLALHNSLKQSRDWSLDTLLELRPDIAPIGKRLIASMILELEFHSKSPQREPLPKEDWFTRFFGELASGTKCLEDFAKNPEVLITYNYDRLLEYHLVRALAAHYGRSEADCIVTLRRYRSSTCTGISARFRDLLATIGWFRLVRRQCLPMSGQHSRSMWIVLLTALSLYTRQRMRRRTSIGPGRRCKA